MYRKSISMAPPFQEVAVQGPLHIQPYASRTGTRVNLEAMSRNGFGLLVSATGVHRTEGFDNHVLDNGAWSAWNSGTPWDRSKFETLCKKFGATAQWVVVPDVVADRAATLTKAQEWLPLLANVGKMRLLAAQDGMVPDDIRAWLSHDVGIFVGGTTEWKWSHLHQWGDLAAERGCRLHVGRVNTRKAIRKCRDVGAHSFDGTSATRFAVTADKIGRWCREDWPKNV